MLKKIFVLFLSSVLTVSLLVGCGEEQSDIQGDKGPVTVGSMIDSEGAILGKMMVMLLERNGFAVVDKTEFGTPDVMRPALVSGELDLVLDYTGSGQYYFDSPDSAIWTNGETGYAEVAKLDKAANNLVWLTPAKANNSEFFAVKRSFAQENNITDMTSLAAYINSGKPFKFICAAGFAQKERGLLGYEAAYGFKLRDDQLITLASGNTAEMIKALAEGTDGVNACLAYGTDGQLNDLDMVIVTDTKDVPPVYWPTPVLNGELAEKYPEIGQIFQPVFESLTLEKLQELNAKVAFDGLDAASVAEAYLQENGFMD